MKMTEQESDHHRGLAIILGYLSASLAAGLMYSVIFAVYYGASAGIVLPGAIGFGFSVAIWALPPSILGIVYAERVNARSILFYASGGVLVGWVSYGLLALLLIIGAGTTKGFISGDQVTFWLKLSLAFGGPGLVGGLVYWSIAGRHAGRSGASA
jgi:hypothetical protein